jgi:hypothetical protein
MFSHGSAMVRAPSSHVSAAFCCIVLQSACHAFLFTAVQFVIAAAAQLMVSYYDTL